MTPAQLSKATITLAVGAAIGTVGLWVTAPLWRDRISDDRIEPRNAVQVLR